MSFGLYAVFFTHFINFINLIVQQGCVVCKPFVNRVTFFSLKSVGRLSPAINLLPSFSSLCVASYYPYL